MLFTSTCSYYILFVYNNVLGDRMILNGSKNIAQCFPIGIMQFLNQHTPKYQKRSKHFVCTRLPDMPTVRDTRFSQRTINVWNKLSTDCVHASSVNVFNNRIDKYFVKAGYT